MGVTGLWQLISPVGKLIPLETLENKILAIDISIWLNQAVKGFRDAQGGAQANAHLLGLFHRVCKLLFYKIKPVFVFDGSAPLLKKQTIESRRKRRQAAINSAEKTAQQILTNLMARELVNEASSSNTAKFKDSPRKKFKAAGSTKVNPDDDIFWLPPLPDNLELIDENLSKSSESIMPLVNDVIPTIHDTILEREYQNMNELDIESPEFNSLPPNIKHEILNEMKERKKLQFYKQHEMPRESETFSDYQMNCLLKRRQLTKKLDEVKKELYSQAAGELMSNLDGELTEMQKIASEDNTHTILIQTTNRNKRAELANKEAPQRGISPNECEINDSNDPNPDFAIDDCGMDTVETQMVLQKIIEKSIAADKNKIIKDTVIEEITSIEDAKFENRDSPIPLTNQNIETIDEDEFIIDDSSDSDLECITVKKSPDISENSKTEKTDSGILKNTLGSRIKSLSVVLDISKPPLEDDLFPCEIFNTVNKDVLSAGCSVVEDKLNNTNYDLTSTSSTVENILDTKYSVREDGSPAKSTASPKCHVIEDGSPSKSTTSPKCHVIEDGSPSKSTTSPKCDVIEDGSQSKSTTSPKCDVIEDGSQSKSTTSPKCHVIEDGSPAKSTTSPKCDVIEDGSPTKSTASPKCNVIEDFLSSKISPGKRVGYDPKYESSQGSQMVQGVSALVDMTEENLSDLRNELDMERLEFIREQKKNERQARTLSDQILLESQELLKLFGVPFIVSPGEAEAQCAQLELFGLTHGTITDDSDIWLFGGSTVFKNFFTQGKFLECYANKDIESHFGLDRTQLICFALLTGSDYTEGIDGVGPVKAMEVISEFKKDGFETLKGFREWWDLCRKSSQSPGNKVRSKLSKLELPETFPHYHVYEAYIKPEVDVSKEKFSWGLPNLDELRQLSKDKLGWTREKVDEILLPIMKKVSERESQMRIDSYYKVIITQKQQNLFPSKRIQSALTKIKPSIQEGASSSTSKSALKVRKTIQRGKRGVKNVGSKRQIRKVTTEIILSEDSSSDDCVEVTNTESRSRSVNEPYTTSNIAKSKRTALRKKK